MNQQIPIFYACDDAFVKYTIVSLTSIKENASKNRQYHVYVLYTDISEDMKEKLLALSDENFEVSFENVTKQLRSISKRLPLRHYYSKTTYYRLFIATMFPEIDKAIYIDSDTIVLGDISKLYDTELGKNLLGACHEQAMEQIDVYGTYAETVVGVSRNEFFNAGILLINTKQFREFCVLDKFIYYLGVYDFIVTQDEDYLNLVCKDRVLWLNQKWNTELVEMFSYDYDICEANILHYIMVNKPWHYHECRGANIFWKYAKMTSVYDILVKELESYTDDERARDSASADHLYQMAIDETEREDAFYKVWKEKLPLV